jgi:hypothetical protein
MDVSNDIKAAAISAKASRDAAENSERIVHAIIKADTAENKRLAALSGDDAYAVVVAVPPPFSWADTDDLQRTLRRIIPNCAALKFASGAWTGDSKFFLPLKPADLAMGKPAIILMSGKGLVLWEMHKMILQIKDSETPFPLGVTHASDYHLIGDAYKNAVRSLLTRGALNDTSGPCMHVDCSRDITLQNKCYTLNIAQLPQTRVCTRCIENDYMHPFFKALHKAICAKYTELVSKTGTRRGYIAPPAKRTKIDADADVEVVPPVSIEEGVRRMAEMGTAAAAVQDLPRKMAEMATVSKEIPAAVRAKFGAAAVINEDDRLFVLPCNNGKVRCVITWVSFLDRYESVEVKPAEGDKWVSDTCKWETHDDISYADTLDELFVDIADHEASGIALVSE